MNKDEDRIPKNSKTKLPSLQFYPYDWRNDNELQSCLIGARGLWIELICLMHDSQQYGYLLINGQKPDDKTLARLTHTHPQTFRKLRDELIKNGVARLTSEEVIYCKRMVKDHELREKRREIGKLGGNPLLKGEVNQLAEEEKEDVVEGEKETGKEKILKSVVVNSSSFSSVDSLVCPKCGSPVKESGKGFVICTKTDCDFGDRIEKAKRKGE
jgi:hypothetical protein